MCFVSLFLLFSPLFPSSFFVQPCLHCSGFASGLFVTTYSTSVSFLPPFFRGGNFLRISYLEHKTYDWLCSKINSLVDPLFWQLSRGGYSHGLGMSHATTASPKSSFRSPWRVGDAMVSRENAGWTTPKSGHPRPCQNYSQRPPAEKTGRGSLLNRCQVLSTTQSVNGLK